jgi:hypothetical protein
LWRRWRGDWWWLQWLRQRWRYRFDTPHIDAQPPVFEQQFDDPVLEHFDDEVRPSPVG